MNSSRIRAGALALSMPAAPAAPVAVATDAPLFITVVKSTGISWFKRMEVGVKEVGKANGIHAGDEHLAIHTTMNRFAPSSSGQSAVFNNEPLA